MLIFPISNLRRGRLKVALVVGVAALIALIAFAMASRRFGYHGAVEKVSIATIVYPGSVPLFVAKKMRYFDDEGLDVTLVPYTSGSAALQEVISGRIEFGLAAELPLVLAAMRKQPMAIVATIFSGERDHRLVARRDHGILQPSDLKGKRIGFTPGTTSDFLLDLVLGAGGLARQEVQPVALKPEEMLSAIVKGDIDAVSTWEPAVTKIISRLGAASVTFDGFDVQGIFSQNINLVGRKGEIASRPKTVRKILHALAKAEKFIQTHPDAAQKIAASTSGMSEDGVRALWTGYRFDLRLEQSLLISLEDVARWSIKRGFTDALVVPDFSRFIDSDALAEVDPSSVRLIR